MTGEIVKKPYSDVTSDVFIEVHQGVSIAHPHTDVVFKRTYKEEPTIIVTPYAKYTVQVESRSTSGCRIQTGHTSPVDCDILVIGR